MDIGSFPVTANSLNQDFTAEAVNTKWVTDMMRNQKKLMLISAFSQLRFTLVWYGMFVFRDHRTLERSLFVSFRKKRLLYLVKHLSGQEFVCC
jgi:hypothetical protein